MQTEAESVAQEGFNMTDKEIIELIEENHKDGYREGVRDTQDKIIKIIRKFTIDWNNQSSKKIPYFAIYELIEYITQQGVDK